MKRALFLLLPLVFVAGCRITPRGPLSVARKGFVTRVAAKHVPGTPPVVPPPASGLQLVSYAADPGDMPAYLSTIPGDGAKHPAIVWITGGDCNSIDDGVWADAPPTNDQTARAFREAGVVTMYPSLRGGNNSPGAKEGFYGETDDVAAAARFLAKQPGIDPKRIYLGGHSTGGTLALLTAERYPGQFRAAFCFGPVDKVSRYGDDYFPELAHASLKETQLRSPRYWLASLASPTFVIEGSELGNASSLRIMRRLTRNKFAHFSIVPGATHFSVLAPATRLIAQKIVSDDAATVNISLSDAELAASR